MNILTMATAAALSVIVVIIGAAFIFASFKPARKTWKNVPLELRRKWRIIIYLIHFFLLGYIFFDVVLLSGLEFPLELVTAGVFFGGALFVFIIINLAHDTITMIREAEAELTALNESLELRVADRTRELTRAYEFNKTVLDSMNDPISIIDINTHTIIGTNAAFLKHYGLQESETIGRTYREITLHRTDPRTPPHDVCTLIDTVAACGHSTEERLEYTNDERLRHVEIFTTPIRDEHGNIIQAIHIQRDITDRKEAEHQIRCLAYYDNLTGLPNRAFFKDLLTRALTNAKRSNKLMAALFIDLDFFKRINDSLGHDAGDELLRDVAGRLLECVRKTDCITRPDDEAFVNSVSRLGGDEFIVLLNDIAHDHDAAFVARRILNDLRQPYPLGGQDVFISASIGISVYPSDGEDTETLLRNADIAMYNTKEEGKNNYQFFASSMNQ